MYHPELTSPNRHCSHLSGIGEGGRHCRGSDLGHLPRHAHRTGRAGRRLFHHPCGRAPALYSHDSEARDRHCVARRFHHGEMVPCPRSEEHTSELQSLMRISYAVFCLKKKTYHTQIATKIYTTTKQNE